MNETLPLVIDIVVYYHTLLAELFFFFVDFDVLEKDSVRIELSKIFVEHTRHVARI